MHHLTKRTRGSALLTALFIMTLVAIVATAMTIRLQQDIYRTRLIVAHDNLYLASQLVTFWSLSELTNPKKLFTRVNEDGMVDLFPKTMANAYNKVTLSGGIYDLQARFNLNTMLEKKSMNSFINLFKNAVPGANDTLGTAFAMSIHDWIIPFDLARGKDEYTTYYLSQKPPYFPSRQLMQSTSELRLVKDMSANTFQALEPFVTVLPEATPININTAPKQVLMSLGNGLNETQVSDLIMARGQDGIKEMKDVSELLKKLDLSNDFVTIESKYYLSVAYAHSEDFSLTVYTLIKRTKDDKKKPTASIIRESINGF